jgi:alpha-L-fucosidase 2
MNLQGLWSWQMHRRGSCNYTPNFNVQLNYWPALACGSRNACRRTSRFSRKIAEHGRTNARVHFGAGALR